MNTSLKQQMINKGKSRFWKLINDNGGAFSFSKSFMKDEKLTDIVNNNKIISIKEDDKIFIPKFQFDSEGHLYKGIREFIKLYPWDDYTVCLFLLTRTDPKNSKERPIDVITQGDLQRVYDLAELFYQQRP